MAVTDDFTNFYIGGTGSAQYNGGSSKGAPKVDSAALNNIDAVSIDGTYYTLENKDNDGWGATAVDDFLCWDVAGTHEFARVVEINYGSDSDVIRVKKANSAFTADTGKAVNVGGAWSLISYFTARVTTAYVNDAGLPPKGWVVAGTYAAETGTTGFVDVVTNAGTAALPISLEGYTTTEGDGTDTCVVIDGTVAAYHGVYLNKTFWNYRFLQAKSDTNGKSAWYCYVGNGTSILSDLSAITTGNTTSHGFYLYQFSSTLRLHVISAAGSGIYTGTYTAQLVDCKIDAANIGIERYSGIYGGTVGCIIANTVSHGIAFTLPTTSAGAVANCTLYNIGGDGISCVVPTTGPPLSVTGTIFEAIAGEAIDCGANMMPHVSYCAFYNCGGGAGTTYFDANTLGQNTFLSTSPNSNHNVFQTAGTFFVDPTGTPPNDLSLNNIAGQGRLARTTGYPANRDIGAVQSAYPAAGSVAVDVNTGNVVGTRTDAAVANVWKGSGLYGNPGSQLTPTKVALSIPTDTGTLLAEDIVSGVVVDPGADQITGTAAGGGSVIVIDD